MRNILKTTLLALVLATTVISNANADIQSNPRNISTCAGTSGSTAIFYTLIGEYTICDPRVPNQYVDYTACAKMLGYVKNKAQFLQDMNTAGYQMGCN